MGNKVNSSSPTECIYDLLSGKISLHSCKTEEIATHFDIVIFLSTNIAIGEIDVTSKQLNDLIQVYGIILKILLDLYQSNIMITDSYAIECYKKGLHALIRLLVIPQISKKVYEQSFQSISIHLNTSNNQLFSLAFLAFFNGFRYLEESPSSSLSIKSGGQEDTLRQQICLQIDKNDIYPTLFSFLLQASINLSSMTHVTTSILIIRLVSWILNRTSSVTAQLRIKLRYQILQNQETFFELLRHQNYTLSDAVICLLNIIFKQEERGTCVTLQETCRTYGVILWILTKLTRNQIELKRDVLLEKEKILHYGDSMDQTFIPPLESPSKMEILEHLKIFIVHLVVGNKTNSEVVLAAYPRFMQEFLTPSSSFIMNQLSRYVVTEENSSSYFQLYLEKMSTSSSATNRYAYSPNWYLLLSSLNSEIEIPILVWNIGTLEYLLKELEKREESLDFARQLRHEAWDSRYLDINYNDLYLSKYQYVMIDDIFIHRIIDVLELGKSEFIQNPNSFAWELLENIFHCKEMKNISPDSNQYNSDEGLCSGKDLLLLRTFNLLYLRYQEELSDIPISVLTKLLKCGLITSTSSDDISCEPQWIHHCVNILSIRLSHSTQRKLTEFVSTGCIDIFLTIISSYHMMKTLLQYHDIEEDDEEEEEDDNSDEDNHPRTSISKQYDNQFPLETTSIRQRKQSIFRSRRASTSTVNTSHILTRLVSGDHVVINITTFLFTIIHESSYCSIYLGNFTNNSIEKLLKAIWLFSCHGPLRPTSIPIAIEKLAFSLLRILHTSPLSLYPFILSKTKILSILLACGVTPSGDGILLPVIVDLLADILLSIPFYIPQPSSETGNAGIVAATTTIETNGNELNSIDIASLIVKERLSVRQILLSEKGFGTTTSGSSTTTTSINTKSTSSDLQNLLGSDIIMKFSSSNRFLPLTPVLDEITGLIPYQLASLLYQLPSNVFCSQVFNAPGIIKPDIIWNQTLRQDLIIFLYQELSSWHMDSFHCSIGNTDIVQSSTTTTTTSNSAATKYMMLRNEPQLSGIYLIHLINISNSLELMHHIDIRIFAKDIIRTLQTGIGIIRRTSTSTTTPSNRQSIEPIRRDSKTIYDLKNMQYNYNNLFYELSPEKQANYLLLSLSKLLEIFPFPDDIWYNDALPILSNFLEFYFKILIDENNSSRSFSQTIGSNPTSTTTAITTSSSTTGPCPGPSSTTRSTLELSIEPYLCCLFTLLQSLFPYKLVKDESKASLSRIFLNFSPDESGCYGPLLLIKQCPSILNSLKLALKYFNSYSTTGSSSSLPTSRGLVSSQYYSLTLSLSTSFFLHVAGYCYETISSNISNNERKSFNKSNNTSTINDDDNENILRLQQPKGVPTEIHLCLQGLYDHHIFHHLVDCINTKTIQYSPYSTLHALIIFRLYCHTSMCTEYQILFINLILSRGIIYHLLDIITTLFNTHETTSQDTTSRSDESSNENTIPIFTSKEYSFLYHSSLISYDKFSEKIPLPLNRRRSSVNVPMNGNTTTTTNTVAAGAGGNVVVGIHGLLDLTYYSSIRNACSDCIKRNLEFMKLFLLSSSSSSSCPPDHTPTPTPPATSTTAGDKFLNLSSIIPDQLTLYKLIIYESALLLRQLGLISQTYCQKKHTDSTTGSTSTSTTSTTTSSPMRSSYHMISPLLDYLLTPSLQHILINNLSLFLEIFRSNKSTKRPLVIWNSTMQTIMKEHLLQQINSFNRTKEEEDDDDEDHNKHSSSSLSFMSQIPSNILEKDSYKTLYPMLSDEITIDGIYINLLLDPQHRDDIGARNLPTFVEELQSSITSNKKVIELIQKQQQQQQQQQQQRRQSISKNSLVSQISIKQQVLNHILRDHSELGYSDLSFIDEHNV